MYIGLYASFQKISILDFLQLKYNDVLAAVFLSKLHFQLPTKAVAPLGTRIQDILIDIA